MRRRIVHSGTMPNAALREAFLASDLTMREAAEITGLSRHGIGRALGVYRCPVYRGHRTHIRDVTALRILAALGLDPVDVGL